MLVRGRDGSCPARPLRIGSAHGLTPLGNRPFSFERQHDYLPGTHELSQFAEETSFTVHRIKTSASLRVSRSDLIATI